MIRPVKIRLYVAAMHTRGFSADEVLKGTGLDSAKLADPACLVDFPQCRAVISNIIRLTDNQAVGFEIGNEAEFAGLGVVGHAILSCKTVRSSLTLWSRYSSTLLGMLLTIQLDEKSSQQWSLTMTEVLPMGFVYNFCVEEFLAIMVNVGGALAGMMPILKSVELSYPEPSHKAMYQHYLRCSPQFNMSQTRVTFAAPDLDQPLRGSDEEFNKVCQQHCSQIMRQIASESDLASRLRSLFLSRRGTTPSLEDAATKLEMSSRTLRRRLQDEGWTYHRLVDEFRCDLAKEYLGSTHITTKEISYLLGFKDANTFRRAFKIWTGQTVSEYRLSCGHSNLLGSSTDEA